MNASEADRRTFLKIMGTAVAVTAIPFTAAAQRVLPAAAATHEVIPGSERLEISVIGSLYDAPVNVELAPGELSKPIELTGKGIYRVKAVPYKLDPRWGQSYTFYLLDTNGKELSRMIIGSNSSATFMSYGVQADLVAVHRAT